MALRVRWKKKKNYTAVQSPASRDPPTLWREFGDNGNFASQSDRFEQRLTWGSSGRSCSWRCVRPPPTWPSPAPRPCGKPWRGTFQRVWRSAGPRRTRWKEPWGSSRDLKGRMGHRSQGNGNEKLSSRWSKQKTQHREQRLFCCSNYFKTALTQSVHTRLVKVSSQRCALCEAWLLFLVNTRLTSPISISVVILIQLNIMITG